MYIDACIKELEYSNIFLKCYKLNIQEVTKAMLDVKVHISENTKIANFKHPLPSKKKSRKKNPSIIDQKSKLCIDEFLLFCIIIGKRRSNSILTTFFSTICLTIYLFSIFIERIL